MATRTQSVNQSKTHIVRGAGSVMTKAWYNHKHRRYELDVLTVRNVKSGKIGFPKGRMEELDRVPLVCARREAREETGHVPVIDPQTEFFDVHDYRYFLVGPRWSRLRNYRVRDTGTTDPQWRSMRDLERLARTSPDGVNRGVREFFTRNLVHRMVGLHNVA